MRAAFAPPVGTSQVQRDFRLPEGECSFLAAQGLWQAGTEHTEGPQGNTAFPSVEDTQLSTELEARTLGPDAERWDPTEGQCSPVPPLASPRKAQPHDL